MEKLVPFTSITGVLVMHRLHDRVKDDISSHSAILQLMLEGFALHVDSTPNHDGAIPVLVMLSNIMKDGNVLFNNALNAFYLWSGAI